MPWDMNHSAALDVVSIKLTQQSLQPRAFTGCHRCLAIPYSVEVADPSHRVARVIALVLDYLGLRTAPVRAKSHHCAVPLDRACRRIALEVIRSSIPLFSLCISPLC